MATPRRVVTFLSAACLWTAAGAAAALAGDAGAPPPAGAPAPAPAPTSPRIRTIDAAAAEGLLDVRGSKPASYEEVDLTLTNRSGEPLAVDLAGRHLRPTTGDVQRLGLSHPTTPLERLPGATPGTFPILLAAGEKRTIRMHTCCLDAGKGCPRATDVYALPVAPTPPAVETALRWWVDHPDAAQGWVNTAIWQNDPALLQQIPSSSSGADAAPAMPKGRSVASYAGTVYLLDDGALTSLDHEGVRRFHATGIWSAWPSASGLVAVGVGRSELELWRFGETGDPPWMRLFAIGSKPVTALVPGPSNAFLLAGAGGLPGTLGGLAFASPAGADETAFDAIETLRDTVRPLRLGAVDGAKGTAVLAVWTKGTLSQGPGSTANVHPSAAKIQVYDVDLRTGSPVHRKSFWNVRDLAVGPAGVFGVSRGERLLRLDGERLTPLPLDEPWAEIVAIGGERLLARSPDGKFASVDVRTGRWQPLPDGADAASKQRPSSLTVDAKTDQVLWIEGDVAKRWTPGKADAETISFR